MRSLPPLRIVLAIIFIGSGFALFSGAIDHDSILRGTAALVAVVSLAGLFLFASDPTPASAVVSSNDSHAQLSRLQQQLVEQERHLDRIEGSLPSFLGSSGLTAAEPQDYGPQFAQLAAAIQELREYALLPDADRRQRLEAHRQERKTVMLAEVSRLVAAHDWPAAERLLLSLSSEFPNESEVGKARHYLDHTRSLFAGETIVKSTAEIEESLAAGAMERALDQARALAVGFPTRGDVQSLLGRVQREHAVATEATAKRLFDDIRRASDERQWRTALELAQRLLQRFPSHRHAESVRGNLAALRENAEIEERQGLELRIQELIRDGQLNDAIELAEDVIHRFPNSPQAESLEKMLPRIHAIAAEGGAEVSSEPQAG